MYKVLIADDEPPARDKLRYLLATETDFALVGEAANGADAIRLAREMSPNLLILDVEMPPPDGLGVVRELVRPGGPCVILVTAHAQHAVEAYEANVLDYLLKPYPPGRFAEALNRVRQRLGERKPEDETRSGGGLERLLVKTNDRYAVVRTQDIIRAESAANYVVLHTRDGNHVLRRTLNELCDQLDSARFFRASRSSIVNLHTVCEVLPHRSGGHELRLDDGSRVRLVRNLRELQERLQSCRSEAPTGA